MCCRCNAVSVVPERSGRHGQRRKPMMDRHLSESAFEGVHCRLAIERPTRRIVVMRLAGWDAGEFGDIPMQELSRDLAIDERIELFIDARAVKGASLQVSSE